MGGIESRVKTLERKERERIRAILRSMTQAERQAWLIEAVRELGGPDLSGLPGEEVMEGANGFASRRGPQSVLGGRAQAFHVG